jgi:dUTP pyrophosphatase
MIVSDDFNFVNGSGTLMSEKDFLNKMLTRTIPVVVDPLLLDGDVAPWALPAYAHDGDAGMDVRWAAELDADALDLEYGVNYGYLNPGYALDYVLKSGESVLLSTGIKIAIPYGFEIQARSRSGLGVKHKVVVTQGVATIDSPYRGELKISLTNNSKGDYLLVNRDKICQIVLAPVNFIQWEVVTELPDTDRGEGGFGKSGR